ncbi:hypothetical protein BDV96DRAFT_499566 [Lophiotrema nucula]|uniref:Zn(2)-C6 fungal-type domain-containing protein n=1 Tax=Lophiotrema nucula TaxID=690887 RepID=A0A6A5YX73_9PLEO|nr:hypothetical protein BDV96DRAFT_499566 [Lophiotrema nucula]
MNFVDVQPKSFLDYAWTTPSPAPGSIAKPSKTSRKQNRCCDQCRKGKRACDAAILEDTLLDNNGSSGSNPTIFHYSDVFGPLAPCGNCEKTKKTCTFDWLRSQRVLQAAPQPSAAPPAKRRRKSSSSKSPQNRHDTAQEVLAEAAPQPTKLSDMGRTALATERNGVEEFGLTFADFPGGIPAFDMNLSPPAFFKSAEDVSNDFDPNESPDQLEDNLENEEIALDHDSGKGSSIGTLSESTADSLDGTSPDSQTSDIRRTPRHADKKHSQIVRSSRKRRRKTSCLSLDRSLLGATSPLAHRYLSSSNNAVLAESLLAIYHDTFENALSCWLTERTCPYSKGSELSLANDAGPDWNRIYHRVFRLDRLASSIRGRNLTFVEDKAASKAINLAIFSFATQWAQSSDRSKAKYPFHSDRKQDDCRVFNGSSGFDRALQISAWREAHNALQKAAEIESFRVVLAQIVFSLTQRPTELHDEIDHTQGLGTENDAPSNERMTTPEHIPKTHSDLVEDDGVDECGDLLSRLNVAIDQDGPPVHLEQGLRLIHSLRSRMAMPAKTVTSCHSMKSQPRCRKHVKSSSEDLNAGDRATVDLLFWLGVMFDTLSSAMHKRPLVVSDEDSDIYADKPRSPPETTTRNRMETQKSQSEDSDSDGLWDEYLFARQRRRLEDTPVRWPCSNDQASSLLCDAAPVKVLLFRKVTRMQTLLSRGVKGQKLEKAVKAALDVYDHWEQLYAPFVQDCIDNHDKLSSRLQSWYICLTGHWHLATLLLADLVEIIDVSELSIPAQREERISTDFIAKFRRRNCFALSDLAQCACPRDDATFSKSGEFHFAVSQGAILTEPWTAVLIRAFATAGVVLLEAAEKSQSALDVECHQEDAFRRADACVQALWYLGRKSDMALSAAKILGDALKQRRKNSEEKLSDMSSFLEAELWEGFEEMSGAFGVECV